MLRAGSNTVVAGLLLVRATAVAQDSAPPAAEPARAAFSVEEIVVTAQRREESLQDVPISVTALGAQAIEERDITSFADVSHGTPGFVFSQTFGQVTPTIRGLGADRFSISNEPGVALYVDDIYYGRPYLPQAALTQLERIEILRGPQGTLYGRNTSGGALKLVTKRPSTELEGSAGIQYGSFDQVVGHGTLSGPIIESLGGRISFFAEDRDGYVENRTRGETVDAHEVLSGRVSAAYEPFDWLRLDLNGDATRQRDTGPIPHAISPVNAGIGGDSAATPTLAPYDAVIASLERELGFALEPLRERLIQNLAAGRRSDDPRVVYQNDPTNTEIETTGVAATAGASFGPIDGKLITGYRDSSRRFTFDLDMTDVPYAKLAPSRTIGRQKSAELQLSSDVDLGSFGSLRWLTGGFFYDEEGEESIKFSLLQLAPEQFAALEGVVPPEIEPLFRSGGLVGLEFAATQDVRSYAGFSDLEWAALDWLRLHLGGRYTVDHKEAVGTVHHPDPSSACQNERGSKSFDAFTVRAGVDVPFDDDRLVYASFSQGFKSGGFNPLICGAESYEPEHVDAVEVGVKSQWLDGRFRLNAAGFVYDFEDIQVEKVVGFVTQVVNAATASIYGAELEATAVVLENLTLEGGLAWLDASFDEFRDDDPFTQLEGEIDLGGNRLTKSPEWSGNLAAQAVHTVGSLVDLSARLEWTYKGTMYFDHFNRFDWRGRPYQLWNLFLNADRAGGRYGIRSFVKNLADEEYFAGQFTASHLIGGPLTYYALPRTWGVELYYRF